jgi:hypothetical protein
MSGMRHWGKQSVETRLAALRSDAAMNRQFSIFESRALSAKQSGTSLTFRKDKTRFAEFTAPVFCCAAKQSYL